MSPMMVGWVPMHASRQCGLQQSFFLPSASLCADSTFPDTKQVATEIVANAGLNEKEAYALLRGNAIRAFKLERWGITE